MTTHSYNAPASLRRRRLMLGLPGAFALPLPMALLGCGGGQGEGEAEAGTADGSIDTAQFVGTGAFTEVKIHVELPAGMAAPPGEMLLQTVVGGFAPVRGGSASIATLNDGRQFATVYAADGYPLMFGFVDAAHSTIDARSTATAILAIGLGSEFTQGQANAAWIAQIGASDAAARLADAIAASLASDPTAIARVDTSIAAAAALSLEALVPPAGAAEERRREMPLGMTVSPGDEASGLKPVIGSEPNTLILQNGRVRRLTAVVRREGHEDASGQWVPDPTRPIVHEWADGDIPSPPGFSSIVGIETELTKYWYGTDAAGLAFGSTQPLALPKEPAEAKRVKYSVAAPMAGNAALGYSEAAYSSLRPSDQRLIDMDGLNPENLTLRQLVIDLLIPLFMTLAGTKTGEAIDGKNAAASKDLKDLAKAMVGEVLLIMQNTIPVVVNRLQGRDKDFPDYHAGDAMREIVRNHLLDYSKPVRVIVPPGRIVDIPAPTRFALEMLRLFLTTVAKTVAPPVDGLLLYATLNGLPTQSNATKTYQITTPGGAKYDYNNNTSFTVGGAFVIFKLMDTVDAFYSTLSRCRLLTDLATSHVLESWDIWVNSAKVRLSPDPFEVTPGYGVKATLTASIVDNDDDDFGKELGPITFDWECTGRWGTLYSTSSTGEPNKFTSSKDTPSADYFPSGSDPDPAAPDEVTVTVYFGGINDPKRQRIGSAKVPVVFAREFSLSILPASGQEVPADQRIGVLATIKESLPQGTTVDWEWSHAGVGAVEAAMPDANPSDSTTTFVAGSSEGPATITVRATVRIPGVGSTPPRVVSTDPARTTLHVKKGLKTLTMSGGWTIEITAPAPGFSQATAYVVVPKVSGAKGYSVLLEKPTPDVSRGVPFPSTRAIDPAAPGPTWEDRGGAYWSGLSGGGGADPWATTNVVPWLTARFSDMKVTVTVTL